MLPRGNTGTWQTCKQMNPSHHGLALGHSRRVNRRAQTSYGSGWTQQVLQADKPKSYTVVWGYGRGRKGTSHLSWHWDITQGANQNMELYKQVSQHCQVAAMGHTNRCAVLIHGGTETWQTCKQTCPCPHVLVLWDISCV